MKNEEIIIEMEPDDTGTFQPKRFVKSKPKKKIVASKQKIKTNPIIKKVEEFKQGIDIGLDILDRLRRL